MKKTRLLSVLLATSMLLAGCGAKKNPTPTPTPTPGPGPVDPPGPDDPNWSAEVLALMDAHLDGVRLAYPGIEMMHEYVEPINTLYLGSQATNLEASFLESYAANFTEAEGWDGMEYEGFYYFEKDVTTAQGTSTVMVDFGIVDPSTGEPADTGALYIEAYDPFTYSWPSTYVEYVLTAFGSEADVPSYTADQYQMYASEMQEGTAGIYCYKENANAELEYKAALEGKGFDVSDGPNDFGYWIAYAPTNDLMIEFGYDAEYKDLDIYFDYYEGPTPEPKEEGFYKVTEEKLDWSGEYLIVYENSATEAYVMAGAVDAINDYVAATISDDFIAYDASLADYIFTIAEVDGGYSVSNGGKYISRTSDSNGMDISETTAYANSISYVDGAVEIVGSAGGHLRFNSASNQMRFRFYKASSYTNQQQIQLYEYYQGDE